jgi:hypothetical protein
VLIRIARPENRAPRHLSPCDSVRQIAAPELHTRLPSMSRFGDWRAAVRYNPPASARMGPSPALFCTCPARFCVIEPSQDAGERSSSVFPDQPRFPPAWLQQWHSRPIADAGLFCCHTRCLPIDHNAAAPWRALRRLSKCPRGRRNGRSRSVRSISFGVRHGRSSGFFITRPASSSVSAA